MADNFGKCTELHEVVWRIILASVSSYIKTSSRIAYFLSTPTKYLECKIKFDKDVGSKVKSRTNSK